MEKINKYAVLDFTEYPGPRYKNQGDHSGEEFYELILKPEFEKVLSASKKDGKTVKLEVNLDNTAGYASSFLDEAFGLLTYNFSEEIVRKHLEIISKEEPDWRDVIFLETIPQWEKKRVKRIPTKPV